MNAALVRRPLAAVYSGALLAFIVLALVLQAGFFAALAQGPETVDGPVVVQAPAAPCANG